MQSKDQSKDGTQWRRWMVRCRSSAGLREPRNISFNSIWEKICWSSVDIPCGRPPRVVHQNPSWPSTFDLL